MTQDLTRDDLSTVSPVTLVGQVREQLREAIVGGVVSSGERLDESRLSRLLEVSRASIREALHQLAGEGLLVYRPNRGMFVRDYDTKSATDLFITRLAIEPVAARFAALLADAKAIGVLNACLREMARAVSDQDWKATMLADAQLHLAVAEASRNDSLFRVVQTLSGETQLLVTKTGPTIYESREELFMEHQDLVRAIETGDPNRAEVLTRDHIDTAASLVLGAVWRSHRDFLDLEDSPKKSVRTIDMDS